MQSLYVREWADIQTIVVDKPFHELNTENIKSKSGIAFEVLDTMYLSKVQLTTTQIDMYYCMVRSLQSNVIYVLFSSGIVLTQADLQDNIELNNNLELLIAY